MPILDDAELVLRAHRYSGVGDWLDESGNGHHATPVGDPPWDGEKFTLNGSNQWFQIADHDDLDFAADESLTIVAVVAAPVDATGSSEVFLDKGAASGPSRGAYTLFQGSTGAARFAISDGSTLAQLDRDVDWASKHALAAVRDVATDQLRIYEDGSQVGSAAPDLTTASLANAQDLFIGRLSAGNSLHWPGDIYGLAIFRAALSDQQIAEAGNALIPRALAGTVSVSADLAGMLVARRALAGTVSAAATLTGDLIKQFDLTVTVGGLADRWTTGKVQRT